jgi:hypothetical protein
MNDGYCDVQSHYLSHQEAKLVAVELSEWGNIVDGL